LLLGYWTAESNIQHDLQGVKLRSRGSALGIMISLRVNRSAQAQTVTVLAESWRARNLENLKLYILITVHII